jgi:20S proteasome alpha/beta subunit
MTLAVAIVTSEGVVLSADSQVTYGETRWQTEKIRRLNDSCIWAGAGDFPLLQRLQETTPPTLVSAPLTALRDQLALTARQCAVSTLNLDLRTAYPLKDAIESLHAYDLIFAEYRDGAPRLLHISPYGPEWAVGFHAVGSGQPFAFALLQRYRGCTLTLDDATLLAYRVVSEAIQVASFGLGPPISVCRVTSEGVHAYETPELDALQDACRVLLRAEIDLLQRPRNSPRPEGGTAAVGPDSPPANPS